jgi:hypothetical protein
LRGFKRGQPDEKSESAVGRDFCDEWSKLAAAFVQGVCGGKNRPFAD